ncbi:MAG: shikimate dehydrogenase [Ornithinimicrobium sp.]
MTADGGSPRLAGVIGSPIGHSLSPVLHRAAYQALGLADWSYRRTEVESGNLRAHLAGLDGSWVGVSVTMPGKEEALRESSEASGRALRTGAANTLVRRNDGWWADNTDIDGITRAFRERGCGRPRSGWLIGSGATARSALVAFFDLGVTHVVIQSRSEPRSETMQLARELGLMVTTRTYDQGWPDLAGVDVAMSTAPGRAELPPPPSVSTGVAEGTVAMDVVYQRRDARWAAQLSAAGAEVIDGSAMLLHQAVEQVRLMTGLEPPVEAMRTALHEALKAGE